MNVYMMLPTAHMTDMSLAKLKKALKSFRAQPAVRTGLEHWVADDQPAKTDAPVIAVLCAERDDLSAVIKISRDARVSPHLAEGDSRPPAKGFVAIDAARAFSALGVI